MGNFHRTLSSYLNALVASGLAIERVAEPAAGVLLAEQQPVFSSLPIFFAGRARRA